MTRKQNLNSKIPFPKIVFSKNYFLHYFFPKIVSMRTHIEKRLPHFVCADFFSGTEPRLHFYCLLFYAENYAVRFWILLSVFCNAMDGVSRRELGVKNYFLHYFFPKIVSTRTRIEKKVSALCLCRFFFRDGTSSSLLLRVF